MCRVRNASRNEAWRHPLLAPLRHAADAARVYHLLAIVELDLNAGHFAGLSLTRNTGEDVASCLRIAKRLVKCWTLEAVQLLREEVQPMLWTLRNGGQPIESCASRALWRAFQDKIDRTEDEVAAQRAEEEERAARTAASARALLDAAAADAAELAATPVVPDEDDEENKPVTPVVAAADATIEPMEATPVVMITPLAGPDWDTVQRMCSRPIASPAQIDAEAQAEAEPATAPANAAEEPQALSSSDEVAAGYTATVVLLQL
jgi:hypothetical protein